MARRGRQRPGPVSATLVNPAVARHAIVEYVAWHNGTRLRSTLGYRSRAEYAEDSKIKKVA